MIQKPKILIVEDHTGIANSLKGDLQQVNFEVEHCDSYSSAYRQINDKMKYDIILLDWNLPDGQGIDLIKHIRSKGLGTPVIFMTARVDIFDKVLALELGSNDYITKPFDSRELIARVRVQLRERKQMTTLDSVNTHELQLGDLVINKLEHKVVFRNKRIELVKKEFELLFLLASYPEKVFSRDEILNKVWGFEHFPTTRTVDTHILQLRQKLSDDIIETIRSVGYRLKRL